MTENKSMGLKELPKIGPLIPYLLLCLLFLGPIIYTKWHEYRTGETRIGIVNLKRHDADKSDIMVYAVINEFSGRPNTLSARYKGYGLESVMLPSGQVFYFDDCNLFKSSEKYSNDCRGYDETKHPVESYDWKIMLVTFPIDRKAGCELPIMEEHRNLYCP